MKKRNGFVSNSSSSSFIIAAKSPPVYVAKMKLPYERSFSTKEALLDYFLEEYCGVNMTNEPQVIESEYGEQYLDCLNAIQEGNTVYFGVVCSEDYDNGEYYLYNRGSLRDENNSYTIIQDLN